MFKRGLKKHNLELADFVASKVYRDLWDNSTDTLNQDNDHEPTIVTSLKVFQDGLLKESLDEFANQINARFVD